ncbi:helix-turn-helix transcriptional regulator [Saccharopolyspora sp. SCSIO 74807]|uniref:helix-turn-helix domain-containing protein n=1 Tax=Saccharopolyspora sp. SCSIO 74807 TaxID=3118084 RepID=UPI0030CB9C5B
MTDELVHDVGERVRFHRLAARKTQPVVAGLAGITGDYLYQIERGKKVPTLKVLVALAAALGVPPSVLIDEGSGSAARPARGFAGVDLHRAMSLPVPDIEESMPLADLRTQIDGAWRLWQCSPRRYSQVPSVLGDLVVEAERALRVSDAAGEAVQRAVADLYGLVRTVAKRTGRVDLAVLAADRSCKAAEASGDQLRAGTAQWNTAHAAMAGDHVDVAEEIAMTAAERMRVQSGPDAAAVHGSLLLLAAVAAARRRDPWVARDRIRAVAPVAYKTGERNTLWTAFGPTNVAMHAVSVEIETGEIGQAAQLADEVEHERSPSIERRVAFLLEQAHSYQQLRDHAGSLILLQSAGREAPEDVAHRPLAHELMRSVVQRAPRTTAREAVRLAKRLGVPVG